jgi:hypothetical protein
MVGWYHEGAGVIDYDDATGGTDDNGNDVHWNYPMNHPGVGGAVTSRLGRIVVLCHRSSTLYQIH